MRLFSDRLVLRTFAMKDLDGFFAYRNDPLVAKYQGWGTPYSMEKAKGFVESMANKESLIEDEWIQFAVALRETDELIGDIGCYVQKNDKRQARIGFSLSSNYWRMRYMSEILLPFMDFLFYDLDMHRIAADCDVENIASFRTLEKLEFRREAYFLENVLVNGVYASEYHYAILQKEWRSRKH